MEIVELNLKHYGKFENHRLTLQPGINIIYGGNETGKTTIHSFVRSMFFGLNRARGKAARNDEYQVRQPWDTPGAFLGSMRVRENGEIYRIDRCFDRSAAPLQLVSETQAQESRNPQEDLNRLLGGISENVFLNTVFIRQAQSETDESLAEELRRYMVNSEQTMDADLDVTRALQLLRKKKKTFEQKKKQDDEQLEKQIEKKQEQAEQIRSELGFFREQLSHYEEQGKSPDISAWGMESGTSRRRSAVSEELLEDGDDDWDAEQTGRGKRLLELLLLIAGILAFAGAFVMPEVQWRIFMGSFAALFFGMILIVHLLLREPGQQSAQTSERSAEAEQNRVRLNREIQKREAAYHKLQDDLEKLYQEHVRLDGADMEIAAVTLAIDRICELTSGIYAQSGSILNERASQILSELTEGRYNRIVLDELSEVRIHTPSRVLGLHQVSGGTMQQIYFALRMASAELLGGSRLPIILDETFVLYDDERLEAALRWLQNSGRQVLLFTCQKREREILSRIAG